MRKLLVTLGVVAVAMTVTGCMSDDSESSARRPAAMAVREAPSFAFVRLDLGQTQTTWRSYSWHTNVDVVEQRSVDEKGQPTVGVLPGAVRPGTMVLERGMAQDSVGIAALFSNGQTAFRAATVTLLSGDGTQIGTYALSGGVVADLKHRSDGTALLETLTLRFGSSTFQM